MPIPKNHKEIKSFLGLTGFYRKFIKDFAKIAKPLTTQLKKDSTINPDEQEYKEAFQTLKLYLMNDPILRHPDFSKHFTLTTDASNFAIGAVLSQEGRPISFASRTLNAHETRYSTIEKELLAIVWATSYFRPYLFGRKFTLQTDHKPLTFLENIQEDNSKLQRWKLKLLEYDFNIKHIKGRDNFVADVVANRNTRTQ